MKKKKELRGKSLRAEYSEKSLYGSLRLNFEIHGKGTKNCIHSSTHSKENLLNAYYEHRHGNIKWAANIHEA